MSKIRIGVICPSEIAYRRFMPALAKCDGFEFAGISTADVTEWNGELTEKIKQSESEKAMRFTEEYGGNLYSSYKELLASSDIDAVYLPLPPALHYKWGMAAIEYGKHIFMEKPFTTSIKDTKDLIDKAEKKDLAVHENYMFAYHSQIQWIRNKLAEGVIGETRLIRIDFGFPFRGSNDFRYIKDLGGGALLDCGGYTLKLAGILLGETARVTSSQLCSKAGFEVDIYGNATLVNDQGLTAQVSFGMDNSYKCNLEIWGSTGTIFTNRILTAPDGFEPTVIIKQADTEQNYVLPGDDTFKKSVEYFKSCIDNRDIRKEHYKEILLQADKVEHINK
ncbi:MAG: Gfo/Idh/MocA family oxidoreductase [Oscillospiraceae bacterium]|nr:Gfo/Idh/MocA family oxidoreductase [Oscillospiraceae bacterium]